MKKRYLLFKQVPHVPHPSRTFRAGQYTSPRAEIGKDIQAELNGDHWSVSCVNAEGMLETVRVHCSCVEEVVIEPVPKKAVAK